MDRDRARKRQNGGWFRIWQLPSLAQDHTLQTQRLLKTTRLEPAIIGTTDQEQDHYAMATTFHSAEYLHPYRHFSNNTLACRRITQHIELK